MPRSDPVALDWVSAETAYALDDLQVLAFRVLVDGQGTDWHRGVALTVGWLRGGEGGVGPVTLRDEQPVTRTLAGAEHWAAVWVDSPDDLKPPLESFCEHDGVPYWKPVVTSVLWARGAQAVLRWLLVNPLEQLDPPMRVPVRNAEGAVATAEELYERASTAATRARWAPEHRRAAWTHAEVTEMRSLRLAALVEESVRRAAVSYRGASNVADGRIER